LELTYFSSTAWSVGPITVEIGPLTYNRENFVKKFRTVLLEKNHFPKSHSFFSVRIDVVTTGNL
jgi:hypothetical protein